MSETVIQEVVVGEPPKEAESSSSSSEVPAEANDSKDSSYSEEGEPSSAEQIANKIVPESSESSDSPEKDPETLATGEQTAEAKQDVAVSTDVPTQAEQVPPENPTIGEELPPTQPLEDFVEPAAASEKRPAEEQTGQSPKRVKSSESEEEK